MTVFCGFPLLDHGRVTGSAVTRSTETAVFRAFGASRRLIADYAAAALVAIDVAQLRRIEATEMRRGCPPFGPAGRPTPAAHGPAGRSEERAVGKAGVRKGRIGGGGE